MNSVTYSMVAILLASAADGAELTREARAPQGMPDQIQGSVSHYVGARADSDPFTSIGISASWDEGYGMWNLLLSQSFTKLYRINQGDAEFLWEDTYGEASRSWYDLIPGYRLDLSVGVTLPVSEFSREQSVISKPSATVALSKGMMEDRLQIGMQSASLYQWNRYTTTRSAPGDGGGDPLRHYTLGLGVFASYRVDNRLTFQGSINYQQDYYEDIGLRNRVSVSQDKALLNENYKFNLKASYLLNQQLTAMIGYLQGSAVESVYGRQEVYLFDEYATLFYAGLGAKI